MNRASAVPSAFTGVGTRFYHSQNDLETVQARFPVMNSRVQEPTLDAARGASGGLSTSYTQKLMLAIRAANKWKEMSRGVTTEIDLCKHRSGSNA